MQLCMLQKQILYMLQKQILLALCNDFESLYRMFAHILLRSKTILVLQWRHGLTRPILRYCLVVGPEKASFTDFENS